jgi:hypothetical protein
VFLREYGGSCLLLVSTAAVVISQLLVMALTVSKHLVVASLSLISWANFYEAEIKVHKIISRSQFPLQILFKWPGANSN